MSAASTSYGEGFDSYAELVRAVQASRGWFRTIVKETGCRMATLRRMANDPTYDPQVSEVERVRSWYREHGVPTRYPRAPRCAARQ